MIEDLNEKFMSNLNIQLESILVSENTEQVQEEQV